MATDDVERVRQIELNKLSKRLKHELKQDIARIYSNSIFSDLELVLGETTLKVNCCILQVRAKSFYSQLCSLQRLYSEGCELDTSTADRLQAFLRDIYIEDDIVASEQIAVKYVKHTTLSPGFDQYATPLTSPSEIFERENSNILEPDVPLSYYSIVPVDWEKELAEQDFLSESFRNIRLKERSKSRTRPQKSVSLNFCNITRGKDSRSFLDLKRAVEEDSLLLQEEGSLCTIDSALSSIDHQRFQEGKPKKIKCYIFHIKNRKSTDSCNECGFFDAEDSLSPCNESLIDMQRGISEKSKMSSNMDMGPDSGLATSAEDIPLDQESGLEACKSISSSVSSDCCVWDSSAGPQHADMNSWVDSAPHEDNSGIQADFVDRVLEELVGKSQPKNQDQGAGKIQECQKGFDVNNTSKHNFFIDASSLMDETEIQNALARGAQDSDTQTSVCSSQMNIPFDIPDTVHFRTQSSHTKSERSVCPLPLKREEDSLVHHSALFETNEYNMKTGTYPGCKSLIQRVQSHPTQEDIKEDKPPSLIRSNTFELETEDDRLALLRQEYERRQGSLIFQRCVSQPSDPLSDCGSDHDLNQHCTSLILPDSDLALGMANMSLFPTHVVDDEIQTPDSLNSDLPETIGQEKYNNKIEEFDIAPSKPEDFVTRSDLHIIEELPPPMSSLVMNEVSSPIPSRRKTESAPILSGAAPPLSPESTFSEKKTRSSHTGPLPSAWVVDISDITNSPEVRRRKASTTMLSTSEYQTGSKADQESLESKSLSSSLGFFIDLKDPRPSRSTKHDSISSSEGSEILRQFSDSVKVEKQGACEFFVDLKHPSDTKPCEVANVSDGSQGSEKKLFSMFIDIGDKMRPKAKPDLLPRSRAPMSPFSSKRKMFVPGTVKQSDIINNDIDEKGLNRVLDNCNVPLTDVPTSASRSDFKKSDSPLLTNAEITTRNPRTVSSARSLVFPSTQNDKEKLKPKSHHVRAHSLSSTKKFASNNSCSLSGLSNSSQHLSSLSLPTSEVCTDNGTRSEFNPKFSSFHSSLPPEELREIKDKKNQDEPVEYSDLSSHITTGSNESSVCSLETYSVHTPEQSSATEDYSSEKKDSFLSAGFLRENQTYENLDGNERKTPAQQTTVKTSSVTGSAPSIAETKVRVDSSFVRLSDLDKEPISSSHHSIPSTTHRMSRSIPETSWIERKSFMSRSTGGGSAILSGSSRSLSRLFPNLSMHSANIGRSKTSSTCSPLTEDLDTMRSSQVSDLSSMQSSAGLEYSTESTDISSGRVSPATQLGDDLLKMFLEEISTDVIVEVGGRRIKAHKCILSSRCQYFAASLSGGWVESAGNVISLQGFSYTVVHFALCHIYSGASTIPDQISIVELASLADMLSLEGLKDVIMYTLKVKYCHFFHKPCAVCSVGVLECLPLAAAYGLDDIYRKSLRWITKYFVRIWPTKTFTALPREFIDKCYQQHVIHMTPENVLETILCCDKLLSTIPTVRWAESVFVLTSRLMQTCIKFMSENFCYVLASENFLSLGREVPWNVSRFQESIVLACEQMPPDQSCRSYSQLCSILCVVEGPNPPPEMSWHSNFVDLLVQLRELSERTLIRQATRAARTPGWGLMPTDLRRKIQDAACLVLAPAEHASSRYKKSTSDTTKQSNQRSSYSRNLDLHQVKMAMVQHAKRTNSNDYHHTVSSVVVRKNPPSDRSKTVSRRSAPITSNKIVEKSHPAPAQARPKTWPSQVKSRYLEKRPVHTKQSESQEHNKSLDAPVPQRRVPAPVKGMFISSSDSSRNSSPAMKRSSNISSSKSKISDSNSRTRSATVNVCNVTHSDASRTMKEEGLSKSSENISRRSLPMNKNQSIGEAIINPLARRVKDSASQEMISRDMQAKPEGINSPSSTLGTQSQSISMSNDSLATVSSCDDARSNHFEKTDGAEICTEPKVKSALNAARDNTINKKADISLTRTPLSLANKKASPSNALRKAPLLASKTVESNVTSLPASIMAKRSISHVVKSPVLSNTGSRLAIPLRTSRSVSSVPDKGHLKANNSSVALSLRKTSSKDQSHSNLISGTSKRASQGSSVVSSASLVGRGSLLKHSQANGNDNDSVNCKDIDKINGDSSVDGTRHPTVGPRSGTFLKDEPTVLKNPVVEKN